MFGRNPGFAILIKGYQMNNEILVEQFCTPPEYEETDFDKKAFAKAAKLNIEFENRILKAYSIGTGPNVLMAHGWGSRASHLVLIARYIANNGFRVVIFDGPAHGKSKKTDDKDMSNMFEYGRAISCVAKNIGNIYAVVGHSLGAITMALTISGIGQLAEYKFYAEKLVLISSPISVSRVLENYSRNRDEINLLPELTYGLENAFSFKVSEYNLFSTLQYISSKIMIIHDEEDDEIPVSDVLLLKKKYNKILLKLTKGFGHHKILVNREMLNSIKEFLIA